MTPTELDARIRFEGLHVTISGEVDSHTAARVLDVSIRTLHRMLADGTAPPHRKRNRRLWFTVEGLADHMNARQ